MEEYSTAPYVALLDRFLRKDNSTLFIPHLEETVEETRKLKPRSSSGPKSTLSVTGKQLYLIACFAFSIHVNFKRIYMVRSGIITEYDCNCRL